MRSLHPLRPPLNTQLQGGLYIFAGTMHFVVPGFYEAAMPPWLPLPVLLHYAAAVLEIAFGLGLFFPGTRRVSAWGLVTLLVLFIQVHVWVMLPQAPRFSFAPDWVLWLRLPWQAVLIFWAFSATKAARLSAPKANP